MDKTPRNAFLKLTWFNLLSDQAKNYGKNIEKQHTQILQILKKLLLHVIAVSFESLQHWTLYPPRQEVRASELTWVLTPRRERQG